MTDYDELYDIPGEDGGGGGASSHADLDDLQGGTPGEYNHLTNAELSKLGGIETSADVTDATNVDAAGAVMNADYGEDTILVANTDDTPITLSVPEQTVIGRITGGDIDALTATEVRTLLNVADGANNYAHPNHSGDVTSVADGATTIASKAVTLAKMADMATASLLGRITADPGVPEVLSKANALSILNVEDGADVTDATNVAAAGAVMESDFTGVGAQVIGSGVGTTTVVPKGTASQVWSMKSDASTAEWATLATSSGVAMTIDITQASHGFAVGDVVRHNGTIYVKAQADSAANAEVVGIVSAVDGNDFTLIVGGRIDTLSGLTAGTVYFLSDATAGLLTATEPTDTDHISKPLLIATSTTAGFFYNMRGYVNTELPDDLISDTAYAASWDGVTTIAPSKNAIYDEINARPRRNIIINGNMSIWQRGISFISTTVTPNSDDTYLMDRWILLSDGNDIVDVTQVITPVPAGAYSAACFDIETEDKKWGILQVLETKDAVQCIGRTVSLSFKARMGASDTSTKLRAAVLSWSSTADTVTSDVISAWADEGTNPTLVANWTYENTPAALAELTDSYQTFKIEGILIDTASTTNIAVFVWSDDKTNAVGDLVYITSVQLELGSVATEFEYKPFSEELAWCQRYYGKSYNYSTTPGTVTDVGEVFKKVEYTHTYCNFDHMRFDIPMRTTPSIVLYSPSSGSTTNPIRTNLGTNHPAKIETSGEKAIQIAADNSSIDAGVNIMIHYTADAEL